MQTQVKEKSSGKRKVKLISPKEEGHVIVSEKVMRNGLCPCGSGKKSKKCCGSDTKFFSVKANNLNKWKHR